MNAKELSRLGIPQGKLRKIAYKALASAAAEGIEPESFGDWLAKIVRDPSAYVDHVVFGVLAAALVKKGRNTALHRYVARQSPAPFKMWGQDLDRGSIDQMNAACSLPVAVRGALMPDAHLGYGLPIGGVLAVKDAVIPYAVGVDIACRMKMTVLDLPLTALEQDSDRLIKALQQETKFGVGASFKKKRQHAVMDRDWSTTRVTQRQKDKAWSQLGTSGSGNHFVEYGVLTVEEPSVGLAPGTYLALLSHSGSRGPGNAVASHYSKVASKYHPELPAAVRHLAWLDFSSQEGQEYWQAMSLMGHYAAANHELIHRHIASHLGVEVLLDIENHHNFAWQEKHDGQDVIVHRKGATPAGTQALGIIPGSMGTQAYVVRGRGNPASLHSASHGAGRLMSRKQAKKTFRWKEAKEFLEERGVTLISAGLDEVPMVYKNIEEVMAAQQDLVQPLARFMPKLVKMAPAGERPED